MEGSSAERNKALLKEMGFICEGKCRICPFPGAACAAHQLENARITKPKKIVAIKKEDGE